MQGISHIHALNIVHRDIKPENILLSPRGAPVIGDFGWAALMSTDKIRGYVGTPKYMAPEVVMDIPYDRKIDILSCSM